MHIAYGQTHRVLCRHELLWRVLQANKFSLCQMSFLFVLCLTSPFLTVFSFMIFPIRKYNISFPSSIEPRDRVPTTRHGSTPHIGGVWPRRRRLHLLRDFARRHHRRTVRHQGRESRWRWLRNRSVQLVWWLRPNILITDSGVTTMSVWCEINLNTSWRSY